MATDNFWGKFRYWRRHRPFWGGLFLILSGVELFLSANMSLGAVEIHIGPQGFLSYLLPLILLICGALCWFTPQQRLFYGIVALLAALYSFIGLNLGGFVFGMLLGIIGGALVIAWGPPKSRPGTPLTDEPTGEPTDHHEDGPVDVGDEIFDQRHDDEPDDIEKTQHIEIAGHDDRPHEQPVRSATQEPAEFAAPSAAPGSGLRRLGRNPKAMVLAIVPLAVTATILVAGSNMQASAAVECPSGLPSRSVSPTATKATTEPATGKTTEPAPAKTTEPAEEKTTAKAAEKTVATAAPEKKKQVEPAAAATTEESHPILDGIEGFVDGVSNLLGINGDEPSPSGSPSPSVTTTEPAHTATTAPGKATDPEKTTDPAKTTDPGTTPAETTKAAEPTKAGPSASTDEIPCLGARVLGLTAGADDVPVVAEKPGKMEVGSLLMRHSTYDGVVDMKTATGSFKALKFSMTRAENKPFKLTIDEPGNATTVITSKELVTDGDVKFYTPRFKGNLFGVIPVVFTPDSPPPLTIDPLWFTNVEIQLAYVRCNTLTGDPLKVAEQMG